MFNNDLIDWSKFDERLKKKITSTNFDSLVKLPVMITLEGFERKKASQFPMNSKSRKQMVKAELELFNKLTDDLVQELHKLGSNNVKTHWINYSLSGELPLRALGIVGKRKEVKKILLSDLQRVVALGNIKEE